LCGSPNSCVITTGGFQFRSLVDSGAEVSLINKRTYDMLKQKPALIIKKVNLKSVNGNSLHVHGCVKLRFKIGSIYKEHMFFVVSNVNRNVILGRDF